MTSILILHPGEMGSSLGACLRCNEHQVGWVSHSRSAATRERAEADDFYEYPSLDRALPIVDVVLSICPPEYAEAIANSVVALNFHGIYIDANATSPMTAERVAALVGENYVDGSIIGPPARRDGATRMYLSGSKASFVRDLFDGTFAAPTDLGPSVSAASALKMCYAAYTKGTSALLVNIRALAEANAVTDALLAEWAISQPDLHARSERTGPSVSRKAWRFAAEMREISSTFAAKGLPSGFHEGAAQIYERLSDFKDQPPATTIDLVSTLLKQD
ncbi:MAG: DUF1932 domain-containing protein [Gammaproteobacteria bacterium]|nr:DUF1932 domain-containing protein [Gammaproteobacteria bacterium]